MTSPVLDLRAALRDVLTRKGLVIFDEARDAAMPFASYGECTVKIWTDGATNYAEHRLSIHVWSRASGDAEALDMAAKIATVIDQGKPTLAGGALVDWRVIGQEMRRPTREGVRCAVLRIFALSEYPRGV